MENSGRKSELMKPILLKAGIPLAFSIAGFIYSMITTRGKPHRKRSSQKPEEDEMETDSQALHSTSQELVADGERDNPILEEEMLSLKNQVCALFNQEQELETRFLCYCGLKEREIALMELRNMLVSEIAHAEALGMRVESLEAEKRVAVEYIRIVEQLGSAKLETGLLHEKIKKLARRNREKSRILSRQDLVLRGKVAEILSCHEELEEKTQLIRRLEDEIMDMKGSVNKLLEEKKELVERLELVESSVSSASKKEIDKNVMEEQEKLLMELEQLRKAQAAENEELIYLRWINACLRHELVRNQDQQIHQDQHIHYEEENGEQRETQDGNENQNLEYNSDPSLTITEHGDSCAGGHKTPKILNKFRKWVKRSDKCRRSWDEKEHKYAYTPMQSVLVARKSCSSA